MSTTKLECKCRELPQLQSLIEEAQQEAEAIKAQLTAQGVDEARAGEYKVTWKAVTSSRLDSKALKTALPDVAERFTIRTTTRRFCVA